MHLGDETQDPGVLCLTNVLRLPDCRNCYFFECYDVVSSRMELERHIEHELATDIAQMEEYSVCDVGGWTVRDLIEHLQIDRCWTLH